MQIMTCTNCGKELTSGMDIEYSQWLTEYFCHPDCATDYYFKDMQSTVVDTGDGVDLKVRGIEIAGGKLYK